MEFQTWSLALCIVRQVTRKYYLAVNTNKSQSVCHAYQLGKSHHLPFHLSSSRSSFPLELIFTDVWALLHNFQIMDIVIIFVLWTIFQNSIGSFLSHKKIDVCNIFLKFKVFVECKFDRKKKNAFNLVGVVNTANLTLFFSLLVLIITFLVHIRINKTIMLCENIDI